MSNSSETPGRVQGTVAPGFESVKAAYEREIGTMAERNTSGEECAGACVASCVPSRGTTNSRGKQIARWLPRCERLALAFSMRMDGFTILMMRAQCREFRCYRNCATHTQPLNVVTTPEYSVHTNGRSRSERDVCLTRARA